MKTETIEQFLKRGGRIKKILPHTSSTHMDKFNKKFIKYTKTKTTVLKRPKNSPFVSKLQQRIENYMEQT